MKSNYYYLFLIYFASLTGCSSFNQMAVNSSSSLLYEASANVETSGNYSNFLLSVAPNLQMLEGLLSVEPKNGKLLAVLTKGYAGLAFAVNETEYLLDYFLDKEESEHLDQLRFNYSLAIGHGMRFLESKGISYDKLINAAKDSDGFSVLLEKSLSHDKVDLEAVLFLAQSIGALINYDKTNLTLVSQLPLVKGLFDWVCGVNPTINFGACDIFYGAYYAGRPKMFGGDPEKGKDYFLKLIEENPHNWLARIAYIQYYLIPLSDEDGYKTQVYFLETARRSYYKSLIWGPFKKERPEFKIKRLRLYQMIAIKRFEIIKKYAKEIF